MSFCDVSGVVAEVDCGGGASRGGRLGFGRVGMLVHESGGFGEWNGMEWKGRKGDEREEVASCVRPVRDEGEDLFYQALLHACVLGRAVSLRSENECILVGGAEMQYQLSEVV